MCFLVRMTWPEPTILAGRPSWSCISQVIERRNGVLEGLFLVTPRPPVPRDLRVADRIRERMANERGEPIKGTIVHDAASSDPMRRELVDWISPVRGLGTARALDIPNMLGLP
jgi:hypothetical protein